MQWILGDSGAVAAVVETPAHMAVVDEVKATLSDLKHVWCIDTGAVDELTGSGSHVADDELEQRRTTAKPDDLATIIYTSGTTGRPKGCELTHGNFLFEAANVVSLKDRSATLADIFGEEGAATLLFLPLAHVFARMIQIGVVMARGTLGHTATSRTCWPTCRPSSRPSSCRCRGSSRRSTTPRSRRPRPTARARSSTRRPATAIAYSEAQDHGGARIGLKAKHALFDRLVYGKLRAALGGKVRCAVSGGAPLGQRLGHFFRGIGLTVLEGYGLTETTAATAFNTPDMIKIGTVGRPLPGRQRADRRRRRGAGQGRPGLRRLLEQPRGHPARRCATAGSRPATGREPAVAHRLRVASGCCSSRRRPGRP